MGHFFVRKGLLRDGEGKGMRINYCKGAMSNYKYEDRDKRFCGVRSPNFLKNRGGKYRGRLTLNQPSDCVYKTSQACELDGNI